MIGSRNSRRGRQHRNVVSEAQHKKLLGLAAADAPLGPVPPIRVGDDDCALLLLEPGSGWRWRLAVLTPSLGRACTVIERDGDWR